MARRRFGSTAIDIAGLPTGTIEGDRAARDRVRPKTIRAREAQATERFKTRQTAQTALDTAKIREAGALGVARLKEAGAGERLGETLGVRREELGAIKAKDVATAEFQRGKVDVSKKGLAVREAELASQEKFRTGSIAQQEKSLAARVRGEEEGRFLKYAGMGEEQRLAAERGPAYLKQQNIAFQETSNRLRAINEMFGDKELTEGDRSIIEEQRAKLYEGLSPDIQRMFPDLEPLEEERDIPFVPFF